MQGWNEKLAETDWWIAVFAPSGIDYALPYLEEIFELPHVSSADASMDPNAGENPTKPRARFAAIGPTTASHLHDKLSLEVSTVAERPKPDELAKAIKSISKQ